MLYQVTWGAYHVTVIQWVRSRHHVIEPVDSAVAVLTSLEGSVTCVVMGLQCWMSKDVEVCSIRNIHLRNIQGVSYWWKNKRKEIVFTE